MQPELQEIVEEEVAVVLHREDVAVVVKEDKQVKVVIYSIHAWNSSARMSKYLTW